MIGYAKYCLVGMIDDELNAQVWQNKSYRAFGLTVFGVGDAKGYYKIPIGFWFTSSIIQKTF